MLSWPIIAILILVGLIAAKCFNHGQENGVQAINSPYHKLYTSITSRVTGAFVFIFLVYVAIYVLERSVREVISGISADYGIILSLLIGVLAFFIELIVGPIALGITLLLPALYMFLILSGLISCYVIWIMSSDKRKFEKIYTDGKIRNFMCDKEIFTMHEFLENLGGRKSSASDSAPKKAAFVMGKKFEEHFTTVKGDLRESSYNVYCMPLIAYDRLKEEIENFLRGVAAHNIIDITEKTTGFVSKAYFIQRALNDLVAAGNVTQIDIGSSLDKKQNKNKNKNKNKKQSESKKEDEEQSAEEKNYIYQHKHSQRQMVSREIEID